MVLYEKDFAEQGACVHYSTRNLSFVRMSILLNKMGISNSKFFLALHDKSLMNIDPHNLGENDNFETKLRIAKECKINPWYYIREIIRVPYQGAENIPYELNRGNLALCWTFFNGIDCFMTIPRQVGKTIGTLALESWLIYIVGVRITVGLFTKDDKLVQENISRLKTMRDSLPAYLINKSAKDTDNKEGLSYYALRNSFKTFVAQKDRRAAEGQGRGETLACQHWDEVAYYANIDISYESAVTSSSTGKEQAQATGIACANILTTTAGKMFEASGKYAFKIKSGCFPFNDKLYDCKAKIDVLQIMHTGGCYNNMLYIEYSWQQLGKSKAWFEKNTANKSPEVVATDFLNIWLSSGENPLMGKELTDKLRKSSIEPMTISFVDNLMLRWFVDPSLIETKEFINMPIILGMDSSDNVGRDYTTLVATNPADMSTIFTSRCNSTNLTFVVQCIINLMLKYPRLIFIPERNRNGAMLLDILIVALRNKKINPFRRIYNTIVQEYNGETSISIDGIDPTHGPIRSHFGFVTAGASGTRDMLYKTVFQEAMRRNTERIYDQNIIDEACSLTVRNGRIDHTVTGHDDTLVAYLLTIYFILYGKNLHFYGLTENDILTHVASDGSTIDPIFKQRQKDYRQKKKELEQAIATCESQFLKQIFEQQLKDICSRIVEGVIDEDIISVNQMHNVGKETPGTYGLDIHHAMSDPLMSTMLF